MNNRLANTKNIYQTEAKRVLCLCSAGLLRSPTMANALHKEYGFNTRAAGVVQEYALIYADQALYFWADEIVCANQEVAEELNDGWLGKKKVVVLDIPDKYEWNDPKLVAEILAQYKERSG